MKLVLNKYKRWNTTDERFVAYLRDNFTKYDNRTLAYMMGRTVDAVRKQLKKMKLKRPRKTKIRTGAPLKRGRKRKELTIFDMLVIGQVERKKRQRVRERNTRTEQLKAIEKKKVTAEFADPPIHCAPVTEGKEYIVTVINGKETIIYGDPVKIKRYIEACQNRFNPKKTKRNGPKNY